jgi:hypothetical protein
VTSIVCGPEKIFFYLAHLPTSGYFSALPNTFLEAKAALASLEAPIPLMLEAAIGYDGCAQYVAFFWGAGSA